MISALYLAALLGGLACAALMDYRYGLFFWSAPRRAGLVLALGVAFFLAWDLGGIGLDIFYKGDSEFMIGVMLAPELPLEELFFLAFLCWMAMNVYLLLKRTIESRTQVAQ
ncbi:lycopene cyclase domain-containing protein [Arthrobacter sp. CAN_A1]|uniref:lycopene cyclase domain-containing protein n=1 Tax=Arthrobacter sp. CAN_A1 TaxID=2787717 RepID=UPI0018CAD51C